MMEDPKTLPWDAAAHLETEADIEAYLDAAREDGDPALMAAALADVARALERTKAAGERTSEVWSS